MNPLEFASDAGMVLALLVAVSFVKCVFDAFRG